MSILDDSKTGRAIRKFLPKYSGEAIWFGSLSASFTTLTAVTAYMISSSPTALLPVAEHMSQLQISQLYEFAFGGFIGGGLVGSTAGPGVWSALFNASSKKTSYTFSQSSDDNPTRLVGKKSSVHKFMQALEMATELMNKESLEAELSDAAFMRAAHYMRDVASALKDIDIFDSSGKTMDAFPVNRDVVDNKGETSSITAFTIDKNGVISKSTADPALSEAMREVEAYLAEKPAEKPRQRVAAGAAPARPANDGTEVAAAPTRRMNM